MLLLPCAVHLACAPTKEYIDGHSASLVDREQGGGDDKADVMLVQVQESIGQVQTELARIRERETGISDRC
eukprot:1320559-Amphidinium_carterae.1